MNSSTTVADVRARVAGSNYFRCCSRSEYFISSINQKTIEIPINAHPSIGGHHAGRIAVMMAKIHPGSGKSMCLNRSRDIRKAQPPSLLRRPSVHTNSHQSYAFSWSTKGHCGPEGGVMEVVQFADSCDGRPVELVVALAVAQQKTFPPYDDEATNRDTPDQGSGAVFRQVEFAPISAFPC